MNRLRGLICPLAAILAVSGCHPNDSPITRAAGVYPNGSFVIDSVGGANDPEAARNYRSDGTLALYAGGMKFELEMKMLSQQYVVVGKWSAERSRITLMADSFRFTNPSEEDQKTLRFPIVASDAVRTTFAHELVLDMSTDRRTLKGLTTSMGPLIGHFEFARPIPH